LPSSPPKLAAGLAKNDGKYEIMQKVVEGTIFFSNFK
jgi:hypothetical protein